MRGRAASPRLRGCDLAERLGRPPETLFICSVGRCAVAAYDPRMVDPATADGTGRLELLSAREAQVLELASAGLTNEQVAQRLDVTVHAVKFHLASIYRKLGVANRTEAAVAYLRNGPGTAPTAEGRG